VQFAELLHALAAVSVKVRLRLQPSVTSIPGEQTGVIDPLQVSLAVMPNACTAAQVGGVGLQPRLIGSIGQPLNVGDVVSLTRKSCWQVLEQPIPSVTVSLSVKF
jgi:hypothetical protein